MSGRTIVVGELHGCFDELNDLLEKAAFGKDDRLVCVGDLIVKGVKNREVLDLFIRDPRFSSVIGNHDRALRDYWRGQPVTLKPSQERVREELEPGRERYSAYLDSLPYTIDLGAFLVVHAGIRPGVDVDKQSLEDLTELRTLGADRTSRAGVPWYQFYSGAKIILFGHWPAPDPRRGPRALGLDTGCVYGYNLTAYIIETGDLISVNARRAYDQPGGRVG
jgi:hypothetical protein